MRQPLVIVLFSTALVSTPAIAQESAINNAINAGTIATQSLVGVLPSPPAMEAAAPFGGGGSDTTYRITQQQEQDITDRAYPLMAAKWPFNRVFVCWEQGDAQFTEQRTLVRRAIQETWEANSALRFIGWNLCNAGAEGIRIAIQDTGPHVKGLGKYVSGIAQGMVLNFTYQNWSPACQAMTNYCNTAIAVHEFGHAIGFAHEQNRPDTPGDCNEPKQGSDGDVLLTPWDLHSVMNYCNPQYSNDGMLSAFDIIAVQYVYGEP